MTNNLFVDYKNNRFINGLIGSNQKDTEINRLIAALKQVTEERDKISQQCNVQMAQKEQFWEISFVFIFVQIFKDLFSRSNPNMDNFQQFITQLDCKSRVLNLRYYLMRLK